MSWTDAHEYYGALHDIEADLNRTGDGVVAWLPEYAEIFGTPERLRLALRTRWRTLVQAQVTQSRDAAGRPTDELIALASRHRGLLRALADDDVTRRSRRVLAGAA